ncbi:MAG TPA: hypothetical protein PLR50_13510, partial [Candidatus Rifleibacterium sp.]|nr:hypothetical protein [Candidatus Rifleibacterium sp.]
RSPASSADPADKSKLPPAGGLSFDLGTPAGGSFDLSAGSADDAGDLQLDMPETPEKSEISLDLNAGGDDFSFDSIDNSAASPAVDLDISMDQGDSGLNFDLLDNSPTEPAGVDDDPFAAPAGFDISLDEAAAEEPADAVSFDEPAVAVSEPAAADEFSFDVAEAAPEPAAREVDAETLAVETESFDFGDLDATPAAAASTPEPVAAVDAGDDDLSGLIVSSTDDFSTTTEVSVDFDDDDTAVSVTTDNDDDDSFLDSLVVETVQPAKPAAAARPAQAPVQAVEPEVEADDELNGLILGIEGKAPAKPVAAPAPVKTEVAYEEDFSALPGADTENEADFDIASLGGLGGELEAVAAFFATGDRTRL